MDGRARVALQQQVGVALRPWTVLRAAPQRGAGGAVVVVVVVVVVASFSRGKRRGISDQVVERPPCLRRAEYITPTSPATTAAVVVLLPKHLSTRGIHKWIDGG